MNGPLGQLLSGYYYPSGSFALLSIISYLIKPDMVSCLVLICFVFGQGTFPTNFWNIFISLRHFHEKSVDTSKIEKDS